MNIRDQIIEALKDSPSALTAKRLALSTNLPQEKILVALRALIRASHIRRVDNNYFELMTVNPKYHKILGTLGVLIPLVKSPHDTHLEVLRNDVYDIIARQKRSFRT